MMTDANTRSYFSIMYHLLCDASIVFCTKPTCAAAAAAVWLKKEISDLNETNLDKRRWKRKQKPYAKGAICFLLNAGVYCHVRPRESLS